MLPPSYQHFGVIGAGAWGTALATTLVRAGRRVTLWAHEPHVATGINTHHENTSYLKGIALDRAVKATSNLADIAACDVWLFATPAQHVRDVGSQLARLATNAVPVILAAKGIEMKTAQMLSAVAAEELPRCPVAILSGPSFAAEVARGLPTALTFAMQDRVLGAALVKVMVSPAFRLYLTQDVIGAQIGGAVKNVLAIACGIITGRQMGDNARAALITRGLTEMMRLGAVLGARPDTLMGLSGLGDLVLTCSSPQSRNMSLGIALGQGQALADILAHRSNVTEGVTTAAAAHKLAKHHNTEMPVVAAVDAVLSGRTSIDEAISDLLARPLKDEGYGV